MFTWIILKKKRLKINPSPQRIPLKWRTHSPSISREKFPPFFLFHHSGRGGNEIPKLTISPGGFRLMCNRNAGEFRYGGTLYSQYKCVCACTTIERHIGGWRGGCVVHVYIFRRSAYVAVSIRYGRVADERFSNECCSIRKRKKSCTSTV